MLTITTNLYLTSVYHSRQVINNNLDNIIEQAESDDIEMDLQLLSVDMHWLLSATSCYIIEIMCVMKIDEDYHDLPYDEKIIRRFFKNQLNYYLRKSDLKYSHTEQFNITTDNTILEINDFKINDYNFELNSDDIVNNDSLQKVKEKKGIKRRIFVLDEDENKN